MQTMMGVAVGAMKGMVLLGISLVYSTILEAIYSTYFRMGFIFNRANILD